ncbi:autophagy-related protein [Boletus edulis]|nr:autophagy-related protein [Boletus edulis]
MSAYGTTRNHAGSAFATSASITLFRRLSWEGTVPLEIRVDPKELPANSDRGLECYYIQAPRVSYLPLLMPELRRFLMDIVFDEAAGKILKEEDWWFESEEGTLLKWYVALPFHHNGHAGAAPASGSGMNIQVAPLKLILHLASPPTEKLLLPPSADSCKQAFMGQLKEVDFIRWGNTKRMTSLRKAEQDGIWEGIKEHNFDDYWRVASKIVPTTAPTRPSSPPPTSGGSSHARPASSDQQSAPDRDGAYNVRSVPVRLYLPDGPVMQDLVPPLLEDGSAHTLSHYLSTHLPLLYPPQPSSSSELAYALIQGIVAPPETEMGWLGASLAGADGWVNICVGISR